MRLLLTAVLAAALTAGLAACEPKKPSEPKTPIPKVHFTHERSNT